MDIAATDKWGFTALHVSVVSGSLECLGLLLKKATKEQVNMRTTELKRNVLRIFCTRNCLYYIDIAVAHGDAEMTELLLQDGRVDMLAADVNGDLPIHVALLQSTKNNQKFTYSQPLKSLTNYL